jgi:hypothetical protein
MPRIFSGPWHPPHIAAGVTALHFLPAWQGLAGGYHISVVAVIALTTLKPGKTMVKGFGGNSM